MQGVPALPAVRHRAEGAPRDDTAPPPTTTSRQHTHSALPHNADRWAHMLYRVCRHHQPCAAELKVHRAVVDNVELDVRVSTGATQRAPSSLSHAVRVGTADRAVEAGPVGAAVRAGRSRPCRRTPPARSRSPGDRRTCCAGRADHLPRRRPTEGAASVPSDGCRWPPPSIASDCRCRSTDQGFRPAAWMGRAERRGDAARSGVAYISRRIGVTTRPIRTLSLSRSPHAPCGSGRRPQWAGAHTARSTFRVRSSLAGTDRQRQ